MTAQLVEPMTQMVNAPVISKKKQDEPIVQVNIALCNLQIKDRTKQFNRSIIANQDVHDSHIFMQAYANIMSMMYLTISLLLHVFFFCPAHNAINGQQ